MQAGIVSVIHRWIVVNEYMRVIGRAKVPVQAAPPMHFSIRFRRDGAAVQSPAVEQAMEAIRHARLDHLGIRMKPVEWKRILP